jgi:hypothetical protein
VITTVRSIRSIFDYYPRDIATLRSAYERQSIFNTGKQQSNESGASTTLRGDLSEPNSSDYHGWRLREASGARKATWRVAQLFRVFLPVQEQRVPRPKVKTRVRQGRGSPVHTSLRVQHLRERWRECQRIDDGVPSIIVSEFYKAGKALVRFNHPFRNCGNL